MADPRKIEQAVRHVRNQKAFIQELLIDALHWDIDERAQDVEEISFEWSAEELRADGLDMHLVDGTIRQIRPFKGNPWGIFILEFRNPDVFATGRGMTGTLRKVLRGLVPSKRKKSSLASFKRENLLFICNHDYQHYRFAHFKTPGKDSQTAPLAAFGWGPDDPIRTLCEYNLNALEWPDGQPDAEGWIAAWGQAFDVEKVTRRFYEDYAAVFEKVEKLIAKQKELTGDDLRMFTQTLFNRLMFLRFMERKGWLTFGGDKNYLRALYAAAGYGKKSFYKGRLYPLFFEGLAVEGKQESDAYGCVPYLNGGLFERSELDKQVADLPDEVFAGILSDEHAGGLFYRYNFTVEESTPLDIEVAVDPEMLGKVFEELVTGRHETGSYYTPRPVVSFMCREALKGYLVDKLLPSPAGGRGVGGEGSRGEGGRGDATRQKIEQAISALVDRQDASKLKETHAREILAALDDLKAVDPACGSGAYLLGLLQEMIVLYRLLHSERLIKDARTLYDLKLRIISQSLYGVDIDSFATKIAMLRLWLSLAVEADEPVPLPNLDFKIETGDSLLGPNPQEIPDLFREQLRRAADELVEEKRHFFLARGQEKETRRRTIAKGEAALREGLHETIGGNVVDWRIQFAEVFAGARKGFDIVLENPPYVDSHTMVKKQPGYRDTLTAQFSTAKGAWDLHIPFWERSLQLLARSGIATLITPNKWLSIGYGKALREMSRGLVYQICDYSTFRAFENVGVASIVVSMKRAGSEQIDVRHFTDGHVLTHRYTVPATYTSKFEKWGVLLSTNLDLIVRLIDSNLKLANICDVEEAFAVAEAYDLAPHVHENAEVRGSKFNFINTGTIDPYVSLWGVSRTTYLKSKYDKPVIEKARFRELFPRRYEQMSCPKIIISGMRHFEAFFDENGDWVAGISTVVLRNFRSPYSPLAMLGILNSRLVRFFLKECFGSLGIDEGINFSRLNVSEVPIPKQSEPQQAGLTETVREIIARKRSDPAASIAEKEDEVDALVYKMYGLSRAEIAAVEGAVLHRKRRKSGEKD